jgi:hypothetical protein
MYAAVRVSAHVEFFQSKSLVFYNNISPTRYTRTAARTAGMLSDYSIKVPAESDRSCSQLQLDSFHLRPLHFRNQQQNLKQYSAKQCPQHSPEHFDTAQDYCISEYSPKSTPWHSQTAADCPIYP